MSTKGLSQDEIDDLLDSLSESEAEGFKELAGEETGVTAVSGKGRKRKRIKLYDFKRPSKFSKEQMRTVSMMHETFARLTTTSLSAMLRSIVNVHVAAVDELTYDEFIRSLSTPSTIAVVQMDPLKGSALLELDPSVMFAVLDRLLGGRGESLGMPRELSDIEVSIAEIIMVRILGNLRESWSQIVDLRPRLSHIETNAQFVQIVAPGEMVLLITLETSIDKTEGILNFCIPYMTLEPIISKLSSQFWYASRNRQTTLENFEEMEKRIDKVELQLAAQVGKTELKLRDIMNIKEGDIIKLDSLAKDPVQFFIGDKLKYNCRVGVLENKHVAVQVLGKVKDVFETDIDELIIGGGK